MKIIDTFTFFNENDLLALRMEELDGVVDCHVLVEAGQNFRGESKPEYLDYERFRPSINDGKLKVWNIPEFPRFMNTWGREEYQRNEIEIALIRTCRPSPNDIIILTDVDEIPRRQVVEHLDQALISNISRLRMVKYSYAINMLTDEGNTAGRAFRFDELKHRSPQEIRKSDPIMVIEDAGWEFSSLGTPEDIYKKLTSFAHDEFDHMLSPQYIANQIMMGNDLLGRDIGMTPVEIDDTWPEGIKRDREYWSWYEWTSD